MKRRLIIVSMIIVLFMSGCTGQVRNGANDHVRPQGNEDTVRMLEAGQTMLPITVVDGIPYVDIGRMAGLIGFQTNWSEDGTLFQIGDNDVVWSFQPDSRTALKEENKVVMEAPARKHQGIMMVPSAALTPLFADEAVFKVEADQVHIFPMPPLIPSGNDESFKDDPEDPTQKPDLEAAVHIRDMETGQRAEMALQSGEGAGIIQQAKKYMGVPYKFGAGPYTKTKRFDCSSFVRFVYGKFGYTLPRTARAQAKKGLLVKKSKLRVGDLLYFYVPGRFKSNKKVGHVGIYMGNQKMIHSSPLPKDGVQISNINNAHWKKTFLFAKRLTK